MNYINDLQVCLREGASIHPLLLEKFIQSCDGDIRKTIMHLQFWLQSKIFKKGDTQHTVILVVRYIIDY
jgi:hypothetical protein